MLSRRVVLSRKAALGVPGIIAVSLPAFKGCGGKPQPWHVHALLLLDLIAQLVTESSHW